MTLVIARRGRSQARCSTRAPQSFGASRIRASRCFRWHLWLLSFGTRFCFRPRCGLFQNIHKDANWLMPCFLGCYILVYLTCTHDFGTCEFAAVAAHGTLAGGNQLHLTQPALSRQVRVEEEIGIAL